MEDIFDRVDARGWVHARRIGGPGEFSFGANEPVVLASVVKVLLVLEFARQVDAGQLDPTDRLRARANDRLGGLGTSGCLDDTELSLRDLALFAMSLSDNTAADLLFERVGVDNVQMLARELGLANTRVIGGPRIVLETMVADAGAADPAEFAVAFPALTVDQIMAMRALDPTRTNSSIPADMTRLLSLIWTDKAGTPAACSYVRTLMERQANWHRLAAAFPDNVMVSAKTGTLPCVRNEIGVVSYPDGERYAVAVFTTIKSTSERRPDVDSAIGQAGLFAVEEIRRH